MTLLALAVGGRGLVDPDEPILHVDDEAFLRSRAAFETTRVYGGHPFKLDEHLARLAGSAARVEIGRIDPEELTRLAGLALEAAGAPDAMLRLFVTPGRDGAASPTQVAMVSTLPEGLEELRARGLKLVSIQLGLDPELRATSPWLLGGVKSTSYAVNMAAEAEARARGADDAVFVRDDGVVLEGPVTNLWWRRGSRLFTPSLELGILAGVTRAAVLEAAPATGYSVLEGTYLLSELLEAEEVFTTSSVREVMPVVRVDDRPIERGPGADALQAALRGMAAA